VQDQHDDADDQQDVNEPAGNVKSQKTKQPENNQNGGDCSEHSVDSFVFERVIQKNEKQLGGKGVAKHQCQSDCGLVFAAVELGP